MLDIPPPAITDFGPFHPLPLNLNENLYLQATSRWQECRRQWRQLMASHSPSISVEWWDARAPYSALSRRELALALYRQHFEAACQIACAEATITVEQLRTLSAISDPPDDVSSGLHVTRPSFSDGRQPWPGTLKIRLTVDQTARHVLYVPGRPQALMLFNSLAELGKWLFDQRQSASAPPASAIVLDYIPLSGDPLRQNWLALLNQTLSAGDHPPEFALATLFAETPTRPAEEAQTEADPAPFALLDPDIPRPLRSAALAREHAALDALLGKEVSVAKDHPLRLTLKRQFEALSLAEQASQTAAQALFESARPQQMLELLHSSNMHYHTLHQARRDGLRAEADLQRTLNQLGASDHRRLMTVLDATDQKARASEVMVARVTLSVTEGGNSYSEELAGVLVIAPPGDENAAMDEGLLLYWPGQSGGLQHFTSRRALEASLFKRTAGDRHAAIHLTPLSGDPLTWALQQQLYSCAQQAVQIIREHLDPGERDAALQRLQALSITLLTVPVVAARELAYAQRQEQERAAELASALPAWLRQLDVSQRPRLQALIEQYLDATQRAHNLLQRDLPSREAFARQRIDERLRLDFSLHENTRVELELPDSTSWKKVVMEGAAPGTPQRNVLIPGPVRRTMTLVELALSNIDQALWWRLSFLRLNISSDVEADRQALSSGLTMAYLRRLVTELDVAGRYEQRLRETFLGSPSASAFATAWRRECLTEPWRLMLKLQGEFALLQGQIDAQGKQVLDFVTDASTAAAYAQDGKNIVLLPAHLTVGGEDTAGQGPSTLAGVTLIVEQTQGLTLLYLPDNPEGDGLRQFDSLEQARRNLFNRCIKNSMVDYLAGRTVSGGFASHVSRINEAQRRNFDALIGIGMKWPATTSLSAHLLNVHMGRLLEAHRDSSRSNDALFLEQQALQSGAVFNYIKMALGLLPFVGTALGVYDAWSSANRAVAAFLRGEVGQGLAEVEAVLLALIDAAMDVLPVVATGPDSLRTLARAVTRRRHLVAAASTSGALRPLPRRQARRAAEQFKGYEYEHQISLADVQPGTQGVYRQVYRHADGDFILSQGRVYRVQLSDTHRGWRLAGTRARLQDADRPR
ncbi:dermonecrotic toxin domain-containing protein [Pseudomonas sp. Eth.TT006]